MVLFQSGKWINSYSESHNSICYGLIKLPSNDILSLHIGIISLHIVGGIEKKSDNFIYLTKLSSRKIEECLNMHRTNSSHDTDQAI